MSMNLTSSDMDICHLDSDATWTELYCFLRIRVRYWVCSSHLSVWRGQEEEVIADIVQESITQTLLYVLKFSLCTEGYTSCNLLKQISRALAYKEYRDCWCQNARLICIRSRKSFFHILIYEEFDSLEIAMDSVFQEWCRNRLASEFAQIPERTRTALLIDLANRVQFDTLPMLLLEHAFLKVGIHLQDYRQRLSTHPGEQSRHEALLRLAYRQFMRQREILKEQEQAGEIQSGEASTLSKKQTPATVEADQELAALALQLEATAPVAEIEPIFRETLRNRLLNIQAQFPVSESAPSGTSRASDEGENPVLTNSDNQLALSDDSEVQNIEDDPELRMLVAYLDANASVAQADPEFRRNLRDKLNDALIADHISEELEKALDDTERALARGYES